MLGQGQEVASADEVASLLLQAMDVGADVARAELWRWSYLRVRPRRACNALARSARLGPVV
jgi:hypothetical protein